MSDKPMTRPPMQPSEWWALVDPRGTVMFVSAAEKTCRDYRPTERRGWTIRRVRVTEVEEVEGE